MTMPKMLMTLSPEAQEALNRIAQEIYLAGQNDAARKCMSFANRRVLFTDIENDIRAAFPYAFKERDHGE